MNFTSFNLHPNIESGIRALGYTEPTPIQNQCIPPILQNRDVMGLAQTGTGKTAAFVLPILERLMNGPRRQIRALIIAPTRELAEQTHDAVGQLGSRTKLKSVTVYGGTNRNLQIRTLRKGADIIVACPGRLLDLMEHGVIDVSHLEVLVLDEADRMFDMGFLPDIRRIIKRLPVQRQTLLFSATMPDDIRKLAQEVLHNSVTVQVGDSAPIATVSHALYLVESPHKTSLLMRLLEKTKTESVLVFTRTKTRATRLARQMEKVGFGATSLQGDLTQNKRQEALNGFRNGKYKILVATDIAARGIDVSQISHVINYDMPDTADAYTHRIGRTGRMERKGDAFTFVTSKDRAFVWTIEKMLGEKIEIRTVGDFDNPVHAPGGNGGLVHRQKYADGQPIIAAPEQSAAHQAFAASPAKQPASGLRDRPRSSSRKPRTFSASKFKSRRPRSFH